MSEHNKQTIINTIEALLSEETIDDGNPVLIGIFAHRMTLVIGMSDATIEDLVPEVVESLRR